MSFAPNGAVPGDRIVGIMTPGKGITVYPIQSPGLAAFDDQPERWLDVRWDVEDAQALFPTRIMVAAINEPGSLGAVASLIGEQGANIDDVMAVCADRGGGDQRTGQARCHARAEIGEQGANIDDVTFSKKSPDFREMIFDIQVFDLKHLNDISRACGCCR